MSGSLLGGILGATIGFLIAGPTGASYGWSLGSMVGGLLDPGELPERFGPRLSDLQTQTSEYGRPIPLIYGAAAISGNVIWSTPMTEVATTVEVKKKGSPTQKITTYTYFVNFAVSVCEGPGTITRIFAGFEKRLIWEAGSNKLSGGGFARVYSGSDSQLPDPLIETALGVGAVPAYRGTCYVVLENYALIDDGNRIPFLLVEVGGAVFIPAPEGSLAMPVTLPASAPLLGSVVANLSSRAGLNVSQYNTTALTETVDGYVIARETSIRAAIDALRPAYFFDSVESAGVVKYVRRGALPLRDIPLTELGATSEPTVGDLLVSTRKLTAEIPRTVHVNYLSRANAYDKATKISQRFSGPMNEQATLDLPLVLSDTKAQEVADANLYISWSQRKTYSFTLPGKYVFLEPTDVIAINGNPMRILKITASPARVFSIEAVSDESSGYVANSVTTESPITPSMTSTVRVMGASRLEML